MYKKSILWFIFNSLSTTGLGLLLLIPILNNYLLNEVIRQETGINTKYYYRPLGQQYTKDELPVTEDKDV